MRRSSGTWWGIVLVVFGVLFLLDNMYEFDLGRIIHTWWPLILILWGVNTLLRHRGPNGVDPMFKIPNPPMQASSGQDSTSNQIISSGVFGDANVSVQSQSFRGGTVSTVFGDTNIDLASADLDSGEHLLKLNGVFGNVVVTLPKEMGFAVSANTVFGHVNVSDVRKEGFSPSLSFESPNFATAPKRLRIHASQVFGDIVVRS